VQILTASEYAGAFHLPTFGTKEEFASWYVLGDASPCQNYVAQTKMQSLFRGFWRVADETYWYGEVDMRSYQIYYMKHNVSLL